MFRAHYSKDMIKTALIGLGRIGKSHAKNLQRIPECRVRAVCSIVPEELAWAREHLGDVELYEDFDDLLARSDVEALFMATSTSEHAAHITKGVKAGKHVFCKKPLGVSMEECRAVQGELAVHQKPSRVFMLGFVRRFDKAYMRAKQNIEEGLIGEPFLIKSQTVDHSDFAPFQLGFTKTSGGIFYDFNVHDIDLARWFLQSDVESVHAVGTSRAFPEFGDMGDADNTVATGQCADGKIAIISASRTAHHGHATQAEIYGTKGMLRIGFTPAWTDVEILDKHGKRQECVYTFFDRFEDAFRTEAEQFFSCIVEGKASPISVDDGVYANQVAEAFTVSFKEKRIVRVSEI